MVQGEEEEDRRKLNLLETATLPSMAVVVAAAPLLAATTEVF